MKFAITPLFVLLTVVASVMGQAASADSVDELLSRETHEARGEHDIREIEEIHARHAEEVFHVRRDIERLERRGRMVCYAGCAGFTGANKIACWRKCDRIWGNTP